MFAGGRTGMLREVLGSFVRKDSFWRIREP
jgi:hypothetical protein